MPTGVHAGLRWVLPADATGTVAISGRAELQLFAFDDGSGVDSSRVLRVRAAHRRPARLARRHARTRTARGLGRPHAAAGRQPRPAARAWCCTTRRVFGQSLGAPRRSATVDDDAVAGAARGARAARRGDAAPHRRPAAAPPRSRWRNLLKALGLIARQRRRGGRRRRSAGARPGGPGAAAARCRRRASSVGAQRAARARSAPSIDLPTRTVRVQGGGSALGRFGWQADLTRLAERAVRPAALRPRCRAAHGGRTATAARPEPARAPRCIGTAAAAAATSRRCGPRPMARRSRACSRRRHPASAAHVALEADAPRRRRGAPGDRRRARCAGPAGRRGQRHRTRAAPAGRPARRPGRLAAQRRLAGRQPGEDPGAVRRAAPADRPDRRRPARRSRWPTA